MPFDALKAFGRSLAKQRRFDKMMRSVAEDISQWQSQPQVLLIAKQCIASIADRDSAPLKKGAPDLLALKKAWAQSLRADASASFPSDAEIRTADRVASIDPRDEIARRLWLACFWLRNSETISRLNKTNSGLVALHMTCKPRLDRAQTSIDSFQRIPSKELSHIKLIGNGEGYAYDEKSRLLQVPALDTYEHLGSKVIDAYAMLAFCPHVKAVIKMDDDHRLFDANVLLNRMHQCAKSTTATQFGSFYYPPYPAGHSHGWHHGKCKDATFGEHAFGFPAPLSWATGEHGYILNRPALLRTLWAKMYYSRWLKSILYEDIAIGEIADKLGIKKRPIDLSQAIAFETSY